MSGSPEKSDSPKSQMIKMMGGYRKTQMIYVAAKLGLADLLAAGPKTADELAKAAGVHSRSLYRLLRALASFGIFAEDAKGCFGMTALAEQLLSDKPHSLRPFALSYGESWWWGAWGGLLHSVRTGETAFDHVHGRGVFDYLGDDEEAAAIFNANMTAMTKTEAQAVVAAYDFSGVGVLVDVGGGHGALTAAILKKHSRTRAIVFDRPSVIEGAENHLAKEGITDRYQLVSGDFFESIPRGGDIYTLKDIVHDWNDERVIAILYNCRRAMTKEATLLIMERVIPPGNEPALGKMIDINMLVMTGGMERTESEYRKLLDSAGFVLDRVVPTSGETSVIEASLK